MNGGRKRQKMARRYKEITYRAPLKEPVETQAYIAEAPGDWRLVVFPGTPARKYLFERFLRLAPAGLEVVLIARPGFGRGHRRAFLDFDDQVAAAKPFLEDKKVVTMGVSYGGELALKAALDFPKEVRGAVTVAALITEPRPYVQPFVDLAGHPFVSPLVPRTLHHSRAEVAGRRAQIGPLFERLKELHSPVTILHGDFDHLVDMADARTLRRYFPDDADVEVRTVSGGSHFLEMQFPKLVYDAVEGVIQRAERRAV